MSAEVISGELLTYADLAKRWRISLRHVRRVIQRLGLKPLDMGYRTKRFKLAAVEAVENKEKKKGYL